MSEGTYSGEYYGTGRCPVCGKSVPLLRDKRLDRHLETLHVEGRHPGRDVRARACPGSREFPEEDMKRYTISDGSLVLVFEHNKKDSFTITAPFCPGLVLEAKFPGLNELFTDATDAMRSALQTKKALGHKT